MVTSYDGPCYCSGPAGHIGSGVTFPTLNTRLVANEPLKIQWESNNATYFSLSLYTYTGHCVLEPPGPGGYNASSIGCDFSDVLQRPLQRVPDTGEAEWVPDAELESRSDYLLQGELTNVDEQMFTVFTSSLFTIVKKEGDKPLTFATWSDIQRNLTKSGTTSTQLTPSPTATGMASAVRTGDAAAGNGGRGGWKINVLLAGIFALGF